MLLKVDAKALEWRSYLELSRDAVGVEEVFKGLDQHTLNQNAFNLPTRLISKVFLFRWIYRGSAYAYSKDPDFTTVSSDVKFWENVINRANSKYSRLFEYQNRLIFDAKSGRPIESPFGRRYVFEYKTNYRGEAFISESDVTNYINQGFGADIMAVYRKILRRNLCGYSGVLAINTVHDDVQLDVDNDPELLYTICIVLEDSWKELHQEVYNIFNYEMVVPFEGEVSFGYNLKNLVEFNRKKDIAQYANPSS